MDNFSYVVVSLKESNGKLYHMCINTDSREEVDKILAEIPQNKYFVKDVLQILESHGYSVVVRRR